MPPETESTHFNHILEPYAKKRGVNIETFMKMYNGDQVHEPELDQYFTHDRAGTLIILPATSSGTPNPPSVRESGHDTTYRFEKRCASLCTIDLNSLVYKYLVDIGQTIRDQYSDQYVPFNSEARSKSLPSRSFVIHVRKGPDGVYWAEFQDWLRQLELFGVNEMLGGESHCWDSKWAKGIAVFAEGSLDGPLDKALNGSIHVVKEDKTAFEVAFTSRLFLDLAERIKVLVNKFLYNEKSGLFFDYDVAEKSQSVYDTVTCFWAMWAGLATQKQTERLVPRALRLFEVTGGLVSGTEESRGRVGIDRPNRQWDYPYGWAPHQMLAWVALAKYGYDDDAVRIAYRWLYTITKSFVDFNGVVPEKFDVVMMNHRVHVEYGNVGTEFKFINREGFGWMNASFVVGFFCFLFVRWRRILTSSF